MEMLILLIIVVSITSTIACPQNCRCEVDITSRNIIAQCKETGISSIPSSGRDPVNVLDLSYNKIEILDENSFKEYTSLEKLFLIFNELERVERLAFEDLPLLVEVDLSDNFLLFIHPDTFVNNHKLQTISLSGNPLVNISDGGPLLVSESITSLDLSYCKLTVLSAQSFSGLPQLQTLDLRSNSLTFMLTDVLSPLLNLKTVYLSNNRWVCNCELWTLLQLVWERQEFAHKPIRCIERDGSMRMFWSAAKKNNECNKKQDNHRTEYVSQSIDKLLLLVVMILTLVIIVLVTLVHICTINKRKTKSQLKTAESYQWLLKNTDYGKILWLPSNKVLQKNTVSK